MLVLSRKLNEAIRIGHHGEIKVIVVRIHGDQVRLGFETDAAVPVHREEVYLARQKQRPAP